MLKLVINQTRNSRIRTGLFTAFVNPYTQSKDEYIQMGIESRRWYSKQRSKKAQPTLICSIT